MLRLFAGSSCCLGKQNEMFEITSPSTLKLNGADFFEEVESNQVSMLYYSKKLCSASKHLFCTCRSSPSIACFDGSDTTSHDTPVTHKRLTDTHIDLKIERTKKLLFSLVKHEI